MTATQTYRLTQYAHGGGCACKIPPGELEAVVAGLLRPDAPRGAAELLVGLGDGDDAAVVRLDGDTVVLDVDPRWNRVGRLSDRLLKVKGVKQVMTETGQRMHTVSGS